MFGFLIVLWLAALPWTLCEFTNPKPGALYTIGNKLTVNYKTDLKTYSIGLWQQALIGGSANKGPVIYQTSNGPSSSFDWVVQIDNLDLSYSNKFFLWFFEGDSSQQGNQSAPHQFITGYFGIQEPQTTSSTVSSTTSSVSTTLSTSTTTTAVSSTTGAATTPPISSPDSSQSKGSDDGGLSTGAKTGIGVGVGVGALVLIGLVVMFLRYKSKKDAEIQQLRTGTQPRPDINHYPSVKELQQPQHPPPIRQSSPAEMY